MTEVGQRVLAGLNESDKQVLIRVCEGETNRDIAAALGTTTQVVKNRMSQVLRKTGQSNRLELVIFAFHHRIVDCPCGGKESE